MYKRIEQYVPAGATLLHPSRQTRQSYDLATAALTTALWPGTLHQRFSVLGYRSDRKDNRVGKNANTATDFCQQTVLHVGCMDEAGILVSGLVFDWVFYSDLIISRTIRLDPYAQLIVSFGTSAIILYDELAPGLVPENFNRQLPQTSMLISEACHRLALDIQRVYMEHIQRLVDKTS